MADRGGLAAAIKRAALKRCSACGIAPAVPDPRMRAICESQAAGPHYLRESAARRADIRLWFPEARSVLMCAFQYWPHPSLRDNRLNSRDLHKLPRRHLRRLPGPASGEFRLARFALFRDYHKILRAELALLLSEIRALAPACAGRVFADTSPVAEKFLAWRAGIGWRGKNTLVLNRELGSYLLLGGIALSLELPADREAGEDLCASCDSCVKACPAGSLTPYKQDAARCLAYWLNEAQAPMPPELAEAAAGMAAGCDRCQEACPRNAAAKKTGLKIFRPIL